MNLKVYSWRKDKHYYINGQILNEKLEKRSQDTKKDYYNGYLKDRQYSHEWYIVKFKTEQGQIITLDHFISTWKDNNKEFNNIYREAL